MYPPIEIARFTLSEFNRNLEGLTDEDATVRLEKQSGAQMNAISWSMAHIAGHWLSRPERLKSFNFQSNDPAPPSLANARSWMEEAQTFTEQWLPDADDALLRSTPEHLRGESIGTGVMRATLHTWFHCGEINAVRQLLGHPTISFLGDITEYLEWRPSETETSYQPGELVRFAISEFERGLAGVTDEEATVQLPKADGTTMNSISWTLGHIATHWLFASAVLTGDQPDYGDRIYFGAGADPTPPTPGAAHELRLRANDVMEACLPQTTNELLSSKRDFGPMRHENLGTQLMRAVLHTWFHIGEINAIRQMLGHDEIQFVGQMQGHLEYGGVG